MISGASTLFGHRVLRSRRAQSSTCRRYASILSLPSTSAVCWRRLDLRVGELASTPAHLQPEVFLVVDPYRVTKVHERYT